ncbi:hypothetical protein [Lacimicrobium sp. SS2-24]|uniref:hypothetical protein n=1 Tax=Lacimicrobium sp. SS2-24 TaxID=2005569 RepID=UPI000B4B7D0D|nr:hypothetical protein [Lacimicrobium sp. SS2-24]
MTTLTTSLLVMALLSGYLLLCWLDKKYHWKLIAWFNAEVDNPFDCKPTERTQDKDHHIQQLQERIQVLETLVTDPAWELHQKIKQLERE